MQKTAGKDDWVEVKIQSPPELVDAISNFLLELGSEGISQEEEIDQKDFNESAPANIPDQLKAYFPERSKWEQKLERLADYLESLHEIFPELAKPEFAVRKFADQKPRLEGEEAKLLRETLRDYKRAGLTLPKEGREEVERLRKELTKLVTDFESNVTKAQQPLRIPRAELEATAIESSLSRPPARALWHPSCRAGRTGVASRHRSPL